MSSQSAASAAGCLSGQPFRSSIDSVQSSFRFSFFSRPCPCRCSFGIVVLSFTALFVCHAYVFRYFGLMGGLSPSPCCLSILPPLAPHVLFASPPCLAPIPFPLRAATRLLRFLFVNVFRCLCGRGLVSRPGYASTKRLLLDFQFFVGIFWVVFPGFFPLGIPKVQRIANLVDLEKCFPMSIWMQNLASIQKRTSLSKFGG